MSIQNKIQLITYPDSLGGNLKTLHKTLQTYFKGFCTGGVHILPPFPSSGDRGFAPLTYMEIEPAFGTWEDIQAIGAEFDVALDLMVNHISAQSIYFKDFLKNGKESQYADMFITLDKIWENGIPDENDIKKIFLRRQCPYSSFKIEKTGESARVWTTFGREDPSEQIDLDVRSEKTRNILQQFFQNFSKNNVKLVRLDAVGFVIKKMGTSCFFVEPEIYDFLDWMKQLANNVGIELLPEVHGEPRIGQMLVEKGYFTYDFILPFTVLNTLMNKNSRSLYAYLKNRPHNLFTMLDCHDGIPVKPDLNGLYESKNAHAIIELCKERGATFSIVMSDEYKDSDGFDVHQIRGTYYSLLGCSDDAYIAARAIQFFVPGIPQVYYVGLLAGENDDYAAEKTGEGREINRHNFTMQEIEQAMNKQVVKRLAWLMEFRNTYDAFNGEFEVIDLGENKVHLAWTDQNTACSITIDLKHFQTIVKYKATEGCVLEKYL